MKLEFICQVAQDSICQIHVTIYNNDNCWSDFANWKYKHLYFHEGSLDCYFFNRTMLNMCMFQLRIFC